jgi:hypothetical protein
MSTVATPPVVSPAKKKFRDHLKEVGKAILAGVTSPTVVPIEKKLAVLVGTRVLLSLGASAGIISVFVLALK